MAAAHPHDPFTAMTLFTCTFEARMSNIACDHAALTPIIGRLVAESRGPFRALNSNFGHFSQPGYERFIKTPAPPVPNAVGHQRKRQGDGTCFNSAIEVVVDLAGATDIPQSMRDNPALVGKRYSLKSFPSTGQTQVTGVVCDDVADGIYFANLWAAFLSDARVGVDPDVPVRVEAHRLVLVNFKFRLALQNDRTVINLARLVEYLRDAKQKKPEGLPFPIREINPSQDRQNMSFKFVCPSGHKIRINIFLLGKVNILGAQEFESPRVIYEWLSGLLRSHWDEFVNQRPLPDAAAGAKPARPAEPPRPAEPAAPGPALNLDEMLDDLLQADTGPPPKALVNNFSATQMGRMLEAFGWLDVSGVGEAEDRGVHEDEERALQRYPVGGGRPAVDRAFEPGYYAVDEYVAHDQYEEYEDYY